MITCRTLEDVVHGYQRRLIVHSCESCGWETLPEAVAWKYPTDVGWWVYHIAHRSEFLVVTHECQP